MKLFRRFRVAGIVVRGAGLTAVKTADAMLLGVPSARDLEALDVPRGPQAAFIPACEVWISVCAKKHE